MRNHQWDRVQRTPMAPDQVKRQEHNKNTLESKNFATACGKAGIPATQRQASKFNRNTGLAYMVKIGRVEVLLDNGKFVKIAKR